jgi:hypothetical protein
MNGRKNYLLPILLLIITHTATAQQADSTRTLKEVVVTSKSKVMEVNESAYNVVAIDAGRLRNTTLDLNIGHATRRDFVFQLNAFQNYSDNSYRVKTKLKDLSTGSWSNETHWFKRFHDNYHNETLIVKAGVANKPWASNLIIGATLSHEKADIQHANNLQIVYGGKERCANSIIPSLKYEKHHLLLKNLLIYGLLSATLPTVSSATMH